MKKIIAVLISFIGIYSASAQYISHGQLHTTNKGITAAHSYGTAPHGHSGARTTTVTIATENFSSGTDTSLPAGWKAGIIGGTGTWHWTGVGSTTMGPMMSTTAANGWMLFDGDSLQTDCGCAPSGWLQSPAYNCSGHTTVRLNFEEFYGHVADTCEIWVSTDSTFATYTRYPVLLNNSLMFFENTANTKLIHMNITAAAAGLPAVYIRYVFLGDNFLDFSWNVDDMSLTELDDHDAGVAGGFLLSPDATAYNGPVFTTPLACVDSIYPGAFLSNYGANVENVPAALNIYQGGASVYTQTLTYPSLGVNAMDSLIWFPAYKPTSVGNYLAVYNTSLTGDADATNDLDTVRLNITDTTWMQNDTVVATNYILYGTFGGPPFASMLGTRFDVPSGATGDTLSGFGVAFSPITSPTTGAGKVSVQLYSRHKGDAGWAYQGTSFARSITAGDISDSIIKWMYFAIDRTASGGLAQFILQPGTSYAAMVQLDHITHDLSIFASAIRKIPGMSGGLLLGDTSLNNGAAAAYHSSDSGFSDNIPFIRLYFGNVPDMTAVQHISLPAASAPYPDPANTVVNIPFIVTNDGNVKATLSDMAGRVVRTLSVKAITGNANKVTFNTSDLPAGVYNYCLDAGDAKTNGKIAVSH